MNMDMDRPQGGDDVLEAGQVFSTPLMSLHQMKFWLGLLAEHTEINIDDIDLHFGVKMNGEDCFVITSPPSLMNIIWENLKELEPTFHVLSRHDTLTYFSDPVRKVYMQ